MAATRAAGICPYDSRRTKIVEAGLAMAAERTQITELATAAGMMLGDVHWDLELLAALEIPGIDEDLWRPVIEPAAEDWHRYQPILRASLANGAAFRQRVLHGRDPEHVEWSGAERAMWVSDAPADLRVNEVFHISAKYDSKCLLNRAPGALFDALLASTNTPRGDHWYHETAPDEYQDFYTALVTAIASDDPEAAYLPDQAIAIDRAGKAVIKRATKGWRRTQPGETLPAYRTLASRVSIESARRWRTALANASDSTRLAMLAQLIRVCGTPYWLLGQANDLPVRCHVVGSGTWRSHYRLARFDVRERPDLGQPQVDWRATLHPASKAPPNIADAGQRIIDGYCEIRWSHGKFQGHPECKVQLRTSVTDLPGYTPLEQPSGRSQERDQLIPST